MAFDVRGIGLFCAEGAVINSMIGAGGAWPCLATFLAFGNEWGLGRLSRYSVFAPPTAGLVRGDLVDSG